MPLKRLRHARKVAGNSNKNNNTGRTKFNLDEEIDSVSEDERDDGRNSNSSGSESSEEEELTAEQKRKKYIYEYLSCWYFYKLLVI